MAAANLTMTIEVGEACAALQVIEALTYRRLRRELTDAQRLRAVRMVARKALRQVTVKQREGRKN